MATSAVALFAARVLMEKFGPTEAWHVATREAIDAHLRNDLPVRDYWKSVQGVLSLIAPRPGPSELDIYDTARMLIAQHGLQEAWRLMMERAALETEDLFRQAITLRVADAIKAMSPGGPEEE